LIRTCYPSAVNDGDAQPVVVSSGEVAPIEVRLQRNRSWLVDERLLDPSARAEVVERIAKAGERIILVENETHSIDLRIAKLQ